MKRRILLLALFLAVGLAGCGETTQQETGSPSAPSQVQDQVSTASPDSAALEIVPPEEFVRISGGTFQMGSPDSEAWRIKDEATHAVTLSDFYISKFEVTQKEYKAVMGTNPSSFLEDNLPVDSVHCGHCRGHRSMRRRLCSHPDQEEKRKLTWWTRTTTIPP